MGRRPSFPTIQPLLAAYLKEVATLESIEGGSARRAFSIGRVTCLASCIPLLQRSLVSTARRCR